MSSFLLASAPSDKGENVRAAPNRTTKVLIVARSAIRQAGLEKMLAGASEFSAVGVSAALAALEERARQLAPDVLVVDCDGESEAAALTTALGPVAVNVSTVVLVDDPAPEVTAALLAAGVAAVIERDSSFDELTSALQATVEGLTVLGTDIARTLAERLPHTGSMEPMLAEELTDRETQVLELLSEGIGNREIAARLRISEHTVKFHISSILSKLRASNRTEAVAHGIRQGLIVV
jgi:DNA-binding NarL/FixJ family response regulator